MNALQRIPLLLGLIMICGAVAAHALRPEKSLAMPLSSVDLAATIPERFGDWKLDTTAGPVVLPTELEAQQSEIYDQMLVRTYVDSAGHQVMLSIAYGSNQSKALQVHRPEVCYAALGFQILEREKANISGLHNGADIPVMRMVAAKNLRNEPVTYWIRIGDQVVRGNVELGVARLEYGLHGYVPDGLLFRVSTITQTNDQGFKLEERFVRDLIEELGDDKRAALLGHSIRKATAATGG